MRLGDGRGESTRWISFLCVFSLRFLDGTVVVYKDEGVLVFRVHIALCAFVTGAEIALFLSEWYIRGLEVMHTEGSYSGSVVLDGDSCCPLECC